LVESLLDLVVDRVLEVMDEYQDKIHQLEHDILLKPKMKIMRSLHVLSGELIMHKRTLDPIKAMVYGLRRYDQERCVALAQMAREAPPRWKSNRKTGMDVVDDVSSSDFGARTASLHNDRVSGYMSHSAKIYLADVCDHMDFVLSSLDMFAGISENLINYGFNTASYEMNEVMSRLTLATVIFLPLTLLAGYFGMNFKAMWSINNNSDLLFWEISLPMLGAIIPLFFFSDIVKMWHFLRKRMLARRVMLGSSGRRF